MWGVDKIKGTAQKFSDFIFDDKDEYEEEYEEELVKDEKAKASAGSELRQRVVGESDYTAPQSQFVPRQPKVERPKLTVHENPALQISVFIPKSFDEVRHIADCLKNKQAVIINYEAVELQDQLRISDFMNGACYVLSGSAQMITKQSVLYVPANVAISKDMFSYDEAMPSFARASEG